MSYMLRLWQVGDGEGAVWRASLEDPHTGERRAFATCQALLDFLEALTVDPPPAGLPPPAAEPP